MLGLGTKLTKSKIVTPGIVTDSLVMKHMYPAGAVQPLSDGAVYFGGNTVDDYIDCGAINLGTSGLSFGGWFWISSTQGDQFATLIGQAGWDTDHVEGALLRLNNNALQMSFGDNTNGVDDIKSIDSDFLTTLRYKDSWSHIYVTLSSGTTGSLTSKGYINGVLQATDTDVNFESNHSTTNFTIGKSVGINGTDSALKGYASNVSLYSRELTQAEVKSIMWKQYADLSTSEKGSLVSWWNLDTNANDSHGSNNGTLV